MTTAGQLAYKVTKDQKWISTSYGTGFTIYPNTNYHMLTVGNTGTVNVKFDPSGLTSGTYTGNIIVKASTRTKTIPVTFTVNPSEEICGDGIDNNCNGQVDEDCLKKSLQYVSGNSQEGDILTSLENPFTVTVVDENNNPTTGNVTWQVTSTPQDGQGHWLSEQSGFSTTLILGDTLGDYIITATCSECTENKTVAFTTKASGPKLSIKLEPEEVWPSKTGGNSVANVIGEVTSYNGRLLNGYGVEFNAEADETSGGHESGHGGQRPVGSFSDKSICYTDDGQCKVKYVASELGGKEKITAKLQSLRFEHIPSQTKDLTVSVPDLVALVGGNYSLKCDIQSCNNYKHSSFYNVVPWTGTFFDFAAKAYRDKFPDSPLLIVTDASLEWGGLYDYKNTWSPPHRTHRVGTDIDVRSKAIPDRNKDDLEKILCKSGGYPKLEFPDLDNEHYHIYFSPYKNYIIDYCQEKELPL